MFSLTIVKNEHKIYKADSYLIENSCTFQSIDIIIAKNSVFLMTFESL